MIGAIREQHLIQSKQHIALGQRQIDSQRELIARLEIGGHDSFEARRLLAQFEEMQALHVASRDRLLIELTGTSSR